MNFCNFNFSINCQITEKGIDAHKIDLPNKTVSVTSSTLGKGEVEEIIKKTGLDTTFNKEC